MAAPNVASEYDIIIIGGGTSGCVLANRLSEDSDVSILVLEAGEDRIKDERVYTPGLVSELVDNPEVDWQYISEPQKAMNERRIKQPRGRLLGGSSAINSFALIYPSKAGLDTWEELGNGGWGWDGMKEYFQKFQTVGSANDTVKRELRPVENGAGTDGPIQACYPITVTPLHKAWLGTFKALGLENTSDPVNGMAIGGYISANHISTDRRERSHAGAAYYDPIRHRSNLSLLTGALVQKIHFDERSAEGATATGVTYLKDGGSHHVKVRKEVLLAAGTFATPQILELSGIGDSKLLQRHGTTTVYNNPNVGENLQDHIRPALSFEFADGVENGVPLPPSEARRLYEEERRGPWAERAVHTFAYLPLDPFLSPSDKQQLSNLLDQHLNDPSLSEFHRKRNDFIRQMITSPSEATATAFAGRQAAIEGAEGRSFLNLFAMLSHHFSTGSCHIVSADAAVHPRIDPQYYSHPLDLEVHARHIQSLVKLARTPPLADLIKPGGAELPVSASDLSIDKAKEFIKEHARTNYHPCGTCSMMPERLGGVVNERLQVYGTKNVRVVDASIMPIIPRGNIITTVYAVAEKAADIISHDLSIKRTT